MRRLLCLVVLGACASNPGVPAFSSGRPPPLPPIGAPRPAAAVTLAMLPLPWWTVAGTPERFILAFDQVTAAAVTGPRVGPVRSRDVAVDAALLEDVRCAWMIVPMGEPRPCVGTTREDAQARAHAPVSRARDDLQAAAGTVGAGAVVDVRCFAQARSVMASGRERWPAHVWCEGTAVAGNATVASVDPTAPSAHAPRSPGSRLVLAADGSVGALGRAAVVGSTLGLRFSPVEGGFVIADLSRDAVVPRPDGLVGLGLTVLGRHPLGRGRADAIAGVSAMAVAINGSTNPDFDGHFQGFVGIAYQSGWRIGGAAQPFVQLRAGVARGSERAPSIQPLIELHLGLSTPERR